MQGTVLSVSSRALLDACRRLGIDTAPVLAAAGVDPAVLDDPDARLPVERVEALWRAAYEVSGDPNLALHAIEVLPPGAYRVVDFLAANAPSVGGAFEKIAAYFPLINDTVRVTCATGPRDASVTIEAPTRPAGVSRPYAEYTLAALYLRIRAGTRQPFPLLRVEFVHPAPADTANHARIFGCPIVWHAPACRLVVDRVAWDTPCAGSDATLFAVLDAHARHLLSQRPAPEDLVARVRSEVDAELGGGSPELSVIARRLAMSERTLQRRLAERGAVFNDLVDERRFERARAYLAARDISAAEVAYLLGFSEPSAFHRAFRRWSGETPTEFRKRTHA